MWGRENRENSKNSRGSFGNKNFCQRIFDELWTQKGSRRSPLDAPRKLPSYCFASGDLFLFGCSEANLSVFSFQDFRKLYYGTFFFFLQLASTVEKILT